MKRFTRSCLLATLIATALGIAARADDYRSARVSDVRGNLSVRGAEDDDFSYVERNAVIRHEDVLWTDDDGRAEIELDRGSWVRLAEDTKLEVRALPPSAEFRIWNGSVYLDLSDRVEGRTLLKTPVGDVQVEPNSVVRVDLDKSESARVSVFNGRVRAFPDEGSSVSLGPGERIYLDAGHIAPDPARFDRGEQDGFDRYHRERVDYFISRPIPRELNEDILGARELNDYGSWVVVENANYWRPRCEPTWRPYSAGYWSYVPSFGYSWVDYSPWGYTTSHYGRWLYRPTYGWLWSPGYAWAPSYVYWSNYGNYCGWAPLDPWDRPCYFGAGSGFGFAFGTGNFFVDFRSWTFCDRDRFYFGRHHRNFGGRSFFAGNEINLRPDGFRPFRDANRELGIPRHSVRGITVSDRGVLARDRVLQLENRVPQARQRLIQDRFKVVASRDRDLLQRGSQVEGFQRNPGTKIDPSQLFRGDEAERRLRRNPGAGDSREARDRQRDDRVARTPGEGQPRGGNDRPDAKPGDRQADARDRSGRDSGFRRGEPGNRRDGDATPGASNGSDPSGRDRAGDARRGDRDRGPDAGKPDAGKPGDRNPADRNPADRAGDRDSIFRRGDGRRSDDRPGDPARTPDPARRDPAQPDNQRRENERRDAERREGEQREAQQREAQRRENERRESERRDAERRDNERRDNERRDAERRESERRESERRESERRESERRESERRESERRESERRESERRDNDRRDADRKGSRGAYQDFPTRNPAPSTSPGQPGSEDRFRRGGDQGRPAYQDYRSAPAAPSAPSGNRDGAYRRTAPGDSSPVRTAPSAGSRSVPDSGSSSRPGYGRGSFGDRSPSPSSPSNSGSYGSGSRSYSSPAPSGGYSRGYSSPSPSTGRSYSSPAPSGSYGRGSGSYSSPAPSGGSSYRGGDNSRGSSGSSSGSRSYSSGSSGSSSYGSSRGSYSSGGFRR